MDLYNFYSGSIQLLEIEEANIESRVANNSKVKHDKNKDYEDSVVLITLKEYFEYAYEYHFIGLWLPLGNNSVKLFEFKRSIFHERQFIPVNVFIK